MKQIINISFFSIIVLLFSCGGPKTDTIVIVQKDNSLFTVGDFDIRLSSKGPRYDYFIPGAIVVLKTDYTFLDKKGAAGKVYRITKDTLVREIGSIDITLGDTVIAEKYLVKDIEFY